MDEIIGRVQVLIPPDAQKRKGARAGWTGGAYAWMRTVLAHEPGRGLYCRRSVMTEPVFADEKHNRRSIASNADSSHWLRGTPREARTYPTATDHCDSHRLSVPSEGTRFRLAALTARAPAGMIRSPDTECWAVRRARPWLDVRRIPRMGS